jgi:hypothetical protein
MSTFKPGVHEAVLLPDTAVAVRRVVAEPITVSAEAGVTVLAPVSTITRGLYFTAVDTERLAPVKVVEAPDTTHPATPPRASVTLVAPREPVIVETATAVLAPVRLAVGCTDRVRLPPVSVNVVVVSPSAAKAGRAVPARSAVAAEAMMRCLRRFMGDVFLDLGAGGQSAVPLGTVSVPSLQR